MTLLVLATVFWQAPATIRIPHGEVRRIEIPAIAGPARLAFRARADYWRPAGSNDFLRIMLNGREVGPMRDRRTSRLTNEPAMVREGIGELRRFNFGRWRVSYGPISSARDELVLDVSDLLHAGESNVLELEHGPATSAGATPLIIDDLRLEAGAGARAAEVPAPPDWVTPRLRLPSPPHFDVQANDTSVRVSWEGRTIDVQTSRRGGSHRWRRTLVVEPTHVAVRDTVENPSDAVIGLHVRHAVSTDAAWVHLGGRPDFDVTDAYDPWNPTVFTPVDRGGLGLVAEDDVFRQQVHVDFDAAASTVGLRTDSLCLGPGDSVTMVWSIYPTRTDSYWDFINVVRRDWGVNRTVPGSYLWFTPDQILATAEDRLATALERQRVAIASMSGGWVDPQRPERPPLIGFGTYVMDQAFADYRTRIRAAIQKLKKARPSMKVLLYFDAQRDSSPGAPERYADSLLIGPGGRPEDTDWGGRFTSAWGMVPTAENSFGRALRDVARAMRELGADGLYWDEMSGVDYLLPRATTTAWDQRSCTLADQGEVKDRIGLVNLLSEAVKLSYASEGFVLGNGPPTTRAFQERPYMRMVEAQHNSAWGAFAHLSTPLGYIGAARNWDLILEKIEEGLLVAGTNLDAEYELPARMFPFTPEYLQPGTLRGSERIITTRSGTHGWLGRGGTVRALRYDASGQVHDAPWHVKRRSAGVFVRVRLAAGEAAVIEREE